jgi:type I restriction enzyme S subunit
MDAIGENWGLDLSRTRAVGEVKSGYSYFEDGDVAFAKVTPCFENGKGALMQGLAQGAGFGTTELTVLRPNQDVCASFLGYVVKSEPFRAVAIASMTGAGGLKRVSDDAVRDFKTYWPELAEQERIANFLDDKTARIDALIAEKERLANVLLESLSGAIELAVTASEHALQFVAPLKRVVTGLITGPFGSALHSSDYVDGGTPVINPAHIQNGRLVPDSQVSVAREKLEELSSYQMTTGQLVVGRRGEMGRCAIVEDTAKGWLCGTGCLLVTPNPNKVLPQYLQLVVSSQRARDWLQLESVGSTMDNLNTEILGRLSGYFPSLEEQQTRCEQADRARVAHGNLLGHVQAHIARLSEYRSSLISAAVTGQIDVGAYEVAA